MDKFIGFRDGIKVFLMPERKFQAFSLEAFSKTQPQAFALG